MTQISAKIIADSKNEQGNRITTMMVTFPRFILAELNTHRMFSRNSASSRAIPFEKMVKSVQSDPFIPIAWQKDHKGMQGSEYFQSNSEINQCIQNWNNAKDSAIIQSKLLNNSSGVTKQLCNRLLEPFMCHTVLITATEFSNFFALRCPQYWCNTDDSIHKSKKDWIKHRKIESRRIDTLDEGQATVSFFKGFSEPTTDEWLFLNKGQAEIHMMALAEAMWDAMNESTPKVLKAGEWHIPFGDDIDDLKVAEYLQSLNNNMFVYNDNTVKQAKIEIATARCARVSYTVVGEEDKPMNFANDIKLHDRLAESGHFSPFEHPSRVMTQDEYNSNQWSGNFKGFVQYRKLLSNENITV